MRGGHELRYGLILLQVESRSSFRLRTQERESIKKRKLFSLENLPVRVAAKI